LLGIGRALSRGGHRAELVGTVRPESGSLQDGTVAENEVIERGLRTVAVSDRDAFETRMILAKSEGMLIGMGSAAAVRVAQSLARPAIAVAVDAGDRYFSVDRRLAR
jgi:cysteine synthase